MATSEIMLSIILLLWRYVNGDVCDRFFEIPNSKLQGHVIETITTTEKDCREICRRNSACDSINYIRKKSQCELNGDTHFSFPEHFISGAAPGAYYATLNPVTSCSSLYCGSGMACKMREDGKTHKCEKGITYKSIGCYVDAKDRAIEGFFVEKVTREYCFKLAVSRGYRVFAMQNRRQCFTGANAHNTYSKYGSGSGCSWGTGGRWRNDVYHINY